MIHKGINLSIHLKGVLIQRNFIYIVIAHIINDLIIDDAARHDTVGNIRPLIFHGNRSDRLGSLTYFSRRAPSY